MLGLVEVGVTPSAESRSDACAELIEVRAPLGSVAILKLAGSEIAPYSMTLSNSCSRRAGASPQACV
jgi:hypothetical protein